MNNFFNNLQWDSDLFGYKIASMKGHEITNDEYKERINYFSKCNYKLIYWFVDPNDSISNETALLNGLVLMDEKATFNKKLNMENRDEKEIIDYENNRPTESMYKLSFQSGIFSRFRIDKKFDNNEFKKLYTKWIEKSVKKEIANKVFVHFKDGTEDGLITANIKDYLGEIGILAVDVESRGKSIGEKLLNRVNFYFFKSGCRNVQIVTQLQNKIACNFYSKNGFILKKIINIYHIWM
jgi:dTDP-4-amino-4,6-dideoxy-D-galactose acyltransferase